jgi:hypothetical protein
MAIYKFVATGFQSAYVFSVRSHPKSETGFEQAVAAPSVANSSTIPHFQDL